MDNLNKAIAFNRMPIASNETENKEEEEEKKSPTHIRSALSLRKILERRVYFKTKGSILTAIGLRNLENVSKQIKRRVRELTSLET